MAGKTFALLLSILCMNPCSAKENEYSLSSPDKRISVYFRVSDNKNACYRIEFAGKAVIGESKLGLIREDEDFSKNMSLESVSDVEIIKADYEMAQGKKRHYSYTANKRIFRLKTASGEKIDVIFQVSDDSVAFRYHFPEKSEAVKKIKEETTSFNFLPGTKAWIQPIAEAKSGWCQTQPSYEEYYKQGIEADKLPRNDAGWVFPALFNCDKYWMLISETAPDRNYCGCRLKQDSAGNEFVIGFPQSAEVFPGGPVNPESKLPWYTPWRIIVIGDSLKTIAESTLGTDLANPTKMKDISFVKPGRASWSWIMLKDDSVVYDVQKRFVDFAADMGWEYCLIDANWDTQIGYEKIKALTKYAKGKKVGLVLWYNSAGNWNTVTYHPKDKLLTHETRVKEFSKLKEMGIKGIKVDFFGGDGQSVMTYYQDIFEDAADFDLSVNCHGATLPRGWQRTYPNLLTFEAVKGFEYVTFDQNNADLQPNHCCVLPFTRNVFDPMDFTPVCFTEVPNIKRVTTNGFELALSVIFTSGIQHFAQTPEGMAAVPDYVKDFIKEVPSRWDDTRFIDGYPGKLVVIARKFNNSWFIAGINGEDTEKSIDLDLTFIKNFKTGVLITDGSRNRSFDMKKITLTTGKPLKIKLKGNGGFIIKVEN
ncbi:MAG: glycoside hydrolase family 97 catalytic domain-containing protein [Phycisphaerae bacterium]|nr:glycoside hydrolase family 97 catalytic domain-containing protein [Phycisphaerae bacterium]MDD5380232.1 glycoside hydrolase family 97 catalytic domain-containing protein [Phycisphaerae bacterium]